jgi:UDP-N-acetylglucosamine 1-carboxyvinyltransferase
MIAALVAQGTSRLRNTGIIRRGYEDFVTKLQSVGAKVRA